MRIQRFTILLTIFAAAAAGYAGCYFNLFSVSSDQEKNVIIVLKSNNVRSDFWQTVSAGAEAAAKEGGLHSTCKVRSRNPTPKPKFKYWRRL